ncbi:MAG: hypothetical protein ACOX5G_03360 [Kiritimatiellia bacterium]|jgi:hypothetical protein
MNSEWAEPLGLDNPKHQLAAVPVANAGAVMEPCAGRKADLRDGMRMRMRTAIAFGSDGGTGGEEL